MVAIVPLNKSLAPLPGSIDAFKTFERSIRQLPKWSLKKGHNSSICLKRDSFYQKMGFHQYYRKTTFYNEDIS
jgi:hypothetical protein